MSQASSRARRLRRPLLVLGLLACLAGGAAWLLWPDDPLGPRAFDRIQLGMTTAEVEAAVGVPGADSIWGDLIIWSFDSPWQVASKGVIDVDRDQVMVWQGDQYLIAVRFDHAGTAIGVSLIKPAPWKRNSFLDRLRAHLGL